jgi:uncharacterized phosphosugar-binding protein
LYEYHNKVNDLFSKIVEHQGDKIEKVSSLMAQAIVDDHIIHTFGTGHSQMIGFEMFARAGGLGNVNAMLDSTTLTHEGTKRAAEMEQVHGLAQIVWQQYKTAKEDIILITSNSGRNAMPIEMALIAKEKGLHVIAITSMEQSTQYPSRHKSGLKLYDIADITIDNHAPSGDGMINIGEATVGAASSVAGLFIVNLLSTEAMKKAHHKGAHLPVYKSQNIDGISNEEIYTQYKDRIKHL